MNGTAGNITPVNINSSGQLPLCSNGNGPFPAWVPEFWFDLFSTCEPGIKDMSAGDPATENFPDRSARSICSTLPEASVVILSGVYPWATTFTRVTICIPSSMTRFISFVVKERVVSAQSQSVNLRNPVPVVQRSYPPPTYNFLQRLRRFDLPRDLQMGPGEYQVGSSRSIPPTTKNHIPSFIEMGFSHRLNW